MDLNLLTAFVSIYEERSLTRAAVRLSITQPSVSHALGRLRRMFDDPLFVRRGRVMVPTRRADEVYAATRRPLEALSGSVTGLAHFDPSTTERTFRMSLTDLGEVDFLPTVAEQFGRYAPRARLETLPLDVTRTPDHLMRGASDLAVTSTRWEQGLRSTVIKREHYVCVRAWDDRRALDRDVMETMRVVLVHRSLGHHAPVQTLHEAGIMLRPHLILQTFIPIPRLVATQGYLSIAPETIAQGWTEHWAIRIDPLPVPCPEVWVRLYWPTEATSVGHRWFVALVTNALRRDGEDPGTRQRAAERAGGQPTTM